MKPITKFRFLSALVVAGLGALSALAQVDYATATLKGTVTDPQGAVIAGATVTATNAATGTSKTGITASDGHYQIPSLTPGIYQVTVDAKGFAKEIARNLEVSVGQSLVFDSHLKLGTATETVEVGADAVPLIQTEQTQQANTINQLQVTELPNISHSMTQQVYTLPGVTNADSTRSQNPGFTGFGTTGFSIGGSNGRNNLSTIDGGENEYGTGQYRVTTIPQDTIQEYQVNRNGFNAEFGFTNGSAINIVTKSGGNQYHGTLYGQFQNHSTSAQNFFNGIEGLPSAYSQNVYAGFTVGGPIKPDKLFFFLSYEYRDLNNPDYTNANLLNAGTVVGPNAAQTSYVNALSASSDPFLAGFAKTVTPGLTPLNDPALKKILTAENGVFINPFRYHNALARFDAQPDATNSVDLRLTYSHDDSAAGNPDASGLFTRDFAILTTWSHTFTPSLLNQVLVQVVPKNVSNNLPNSFQGVNFSLGNLNTGNLGGTSSFGSPSLVPYIAHQRRYQFEDNLSWSRGAHSIKLGASMRLADYNVEDDLWFNQEFDFRDGVIPLISLAGQGCSPTAADPIGPCVVNHLGFFNLTHGFPAAGPVSTNLSAPQSFAFNLPADVLAGFNNPKWHGWGKYFGSYVQDTWKLNSRVTMNAGVRFDSDAEPQPLGNNFYVSPRLGLSWDPVGDQKTVIRASGGLYVAPVDVLIPSYGSLLNGTGQYINEVLGILSATDPRVAVLWNQGVASNLLPFGNLTPSQFQALSSCPAAIPAVSAALCPAGVTLPGFNPTAPGATVGYSVAPNYKNPYTVQASLSIDRQFGRDFSGEVGYTMYHGVHLQMPLDTGLTQIAAGNPICPAAACTDASGGPLYTFNSNQLQHTTYESIGSSIYHGLTGSLTKRFSHGLQFQVNYTWSKTLDNVIDFASFQNWFRPAELNLFRAPSVFDIPHTLVANAVYTTPFKAGTGNAFNSIFADITLSPVVTWRSGLPFSFRTPGLQNVAIPVVSPTTGKIVGGTLTSGQDQNYAMPFNSPRDGNRGADYASTDLVLKKAFFLARDRGLKIELSATGTNIFNRVNFNKVSDTFDNGLPLAGTNTLPNLVNGPFKNLHGVQPTSVSEISQPLSYSSADLPRQIQFGLKLAF